MSNKTMGHCNKHLLSKENQCCVIAKPAEPVATHPSTGPPCIRSNTCAGLRSCLKRRRNRTPWLSPLLLFTNTRRGEHPWGLVASQDSSVPESTPALLFSLACHDCQPTISIHFLSLTHTVLLTSSLMIRLLDILFFHSINQSLITVNPCSN